LKARVARVLSCSLFQMVVARPLAILRTAVGLSWWSSTIDSAEPREMGRTGVVGDRMEGEELRGVSTRVLTAMADIF
jgi:hypothetical protein